MHHLTAQWIPPNERSKFLTSYLGGSVCIALFYPIFGFVMSVWSWEWVFHITGLFGILWYAAWLYFVYDSPAHHPRIDPMEKLYIDQCLEGTLHGSNDKVIRNHSTGTSIGSMAEIIFFCIFPIRFVYHGSQYGHRKQFGLTSLDNLVEFGAL